MPEADHTQSFYDLRGGKGGADWAGGPKDGDPGADQTGDGCCEEGGREVGVRLGGYAMRLAASDAVC